MREIVIRKSIYNPALEHKLYETEIEGEWEFRPAESWMPVYINGPATNPTSIDSDGFGFPLGLGEIVDGDKRVVGFLFRDRKTIVKLENIQEKGQA